MQKIVTTAMICVVMMGVFLYATKAESQIDFSDVPPENRYYNAVQYLKTRGVIEGYEDGTFRPDAKINRAEFLKLVMVGAGIEAGEGKECFPDVMKDTWYSQYVCHAKEKGWVKGYEDGMFRPERTVIVSEAVKIGLEVLGMSPNNEEERLIREMEEKGHKAVFSIKEVEEYAEVRGTWVEPYIRVADMAGVFQSIEYPGKDTEVTRGVMSEMYRAMIKHSKDPLEAWVSQYIKEKGEEGRKKWEEYIRAREERGAYYIDSVYNDEIRWMYKDILEKIEEKRDKEEEEDEEFKELTADAEEVKSMLSKYYCVENKGFGKFDIIPKTFCKRGVYCTEEGILEFNETKCEVNKIVRESRCFKGDRKIALIEILLPEMDASEPFRFYDDKEQYKGKDLFYFLNNNDQLEFDNRNLGANKEIVHNYRLYSLYKIGEKFEEEAKRYGANINVDLDVLGPYQLDYFPEIFTPLEAVGYRKIKDQELRKLVNTYMPREEQKKYDLIFPVIFYSTRHLTSEEYNSSQQWKNIGRLHSDKAAAYFNAGHISGLDYVQVVMHELSHNFCADDLYELSKYRYASVCKRPEGFAEPFKEPLFPQKYAACMCGLSIYARDPKIYNAGTEDIYGDLSVDIMVPNNGLAIDDIRFSPYTAYKFGWIPDWEQWKAPE